MFFPFNFELNLIKSTFLKCLAQILCASTSKLETRLRIMRQTGQGGQVINLDPPNVHFLPYVDVNGCVMLSLDLHTMSADQS